MSEYNIQMNKYDALNAEYDQLYPQPMKHASTHAKDGDDPITPSSIGAAELDESGKIPASQIPSIEVDAYTKTQTLSDTTKTLFGLDATAVPDDALAVLSRFHKGLGNEYVWAKTKSVSIPQYTETRVTNRTAFADYNTYYYTDSFTIENNTFVPVNPQSIKATGSNNPSDFIFLRGKYLFGKNTDPQSRIEKFADDAVFTYDSSWPGWRVSSSIVMQSPHIKTEVTIYGYVNSPDKNAYPPAVSDGYTYMALGQFGAKATIVKGSYTGTGTYGSSNPNSLTFDFAPKVIFIEADSTATAGFAWIYGNSYGISVRGSSIYDNMLTWGSNSLSWYCTRDNYGQLNASGIKYRYIAIG